MHSHLLQFVSRFVLAVALVGLTAFSARSQDRKPVQEPREGSAIEDFRPPEHLTQGAAKHRSEDPGAFRRSLGYEMPTFSDFSAEMIRPLPNQDPDKAYISPAVLALDNGDILVAYVGRGWSGKLWLTRTIDSGETWQPAVELAEGSVRGWQEFYSLTLTRTSTGRILLLSDGVFMSNRLFYSDDDGASWTEAPIDDVVKPWIEDWPGRCGRPDPDMWEDPPSHNTEPIIGPIGDHVWHTYWDVSDGTVKYYASQDGLSWSDEPVTMLANPDSATSFLYLRDVVQTGPDSLLAALKKLTFDPTCSAVNTASSLISRSFDGGMTWSVLEPLDTKGLPSDQGRLRQAPDGTLWYVFQDSLFGWNIGNVRLPQSDIYYMTSVDAGVSWSTPERFTRFIGTDVHPDVAFSTEGPLMVFVSNRFVPGDWTNASDETTPSPLGGRLWFGVLGRTSEHASTMPPIVTFEKLTYRRVVGPREEVVVRAMATDEGVMKRVWVEHSTPDSGTREVDLHNTGRVGSTHADEVEWSGVIGSLPLGDQVDFAVWAEDTDGNRAFSDRIRYWPFLRGYIWDELVPARYYVQPRHDIGRVCLELTSAVPPPDAEDLMWWWNSYLPRSGFLGPWPISSNSAKGAASMRWPCPDGPNYLWLGGIVVGASLTSDPSESKIVGPGWLELGEPVESVGWSDQDYLIRFEDPDSLGLVVTQQSHQFSGGGAEDIIFLEYTIDNTGLSGDLDSLLVALYLNPEIGDRFDDLVAYDHQQGVMYFLDSGDECSRPAAEVDCINGLLGLALVSGHDVDFAGPVSPYCFDCVRDLWNVGIDPNLVAGDPLGPGNVRGMLGVGVPHLGEGDSAKVAFALIMAENLDELLLTKVPLARSKYAEHSPIANEPPTPARIISPPAYTEIWAGAPDSTGVDPGSVLDESFVWDASVDPEGENPSYFLQLSARANFSDRLEEDAGNANKLDGAFYHAEVKNHLEDVGVALFDSTLLYARVVTSDGVIMTRGPQVPYLFRRGTITAVDESSGLPQHYALHANYPNPFNPATTIRFDIPVSGEVSLQVFDMLGREVAYLEDGLLRAGSHVYQWNASNVASGVYVYRLTAGEYVATRTLVLMR